MNASAKMLPANGPAEIEDLLRSSLCSSVNDSALHGTFLQLRDYYIFQSQRTLELARSSEEENKTIEQLMQQHINQEAIIDRLQSENLADKLKLAQTIDPSVLSSHKESIIMLEEIKRQQAEEIQELRHELANASSAELELPKVLDLFKEAKGKMRILSKQYKDAVEENSRLSQENAALKSKSSMNYSLLNQLLLDEDSTLFKTFRELAVVLNIPSDAEDSELEVISKVKLILEENRRLNTSSKKWEQEWQKCNDSNKLLRAEHEKQEQEIEELQKQCAYLQEASQPNEPAIETEERSEDFDHVAEDSHDKVFPLTQEEEARGTADSSQSSEIKRTSVSDGEKPKEPTKQDSKYAEPVEHQIFDSLSQPDEQKDSEFQQVEYQPESLPKISAIQYFIDTAVFQCALPTKSTASPQTSQVFSEIVSEDIEYVNTSFNKAERIPQYDREFFSHSAQGIATLSTQAEDSRHEESLSAHDSEHGNASSGHEIVCENNYTEGQDAAPTKPAQNIQQQNDFPDVGDEPYRDKTPEVFDLQSDQLEPAVFDFEPGNRDSDILF